MSDRLFLPDGQFWLGFDSDGISVAASILKQKPADSEVFERCSEVQLCKLKHGQFAFGVHLSDVEVISDE